jgi:hypothetical protein
MEAMIFSIQVVADHQLHDQILKVSSEALYRRFVDYRSWTGVLLSASRRPTTCLQVASVAYIACGMSSSSQPMESSTTPSKRYDMDWEDGDMAVVVWSLRTKGVLSIQKTSFSISDPLLEATN